MSLTKKGLGRGLEALLVEVPTLAESSLQSYDAQSLPTSDNNPFVVAELYATNSLPNHKATSQQVLLKEAEALRSFLDDLETTLRHYAI
jgi:hypothetical protein